MVQTTFSVGNAGSLATVLSDIGGGADSAINTAYTITMTGGLAAASESVVVPSGSSVTLVGTSPFIVPAFSVTGSLVSDLNFTGTLTLDGGTFNNLAVTLNSGMIANGLFSGAVLGTVGDGGDTVINNGSILYTGPYAAVELDSGLVQNGWNGVASALISGAAGGVLLVTGGTVQNGGTVVATGTASAGVFLGSGTVFNGQIGATGAVISGGQNGLEIQNAGVLNNAGTIIGVTSDGAYLGSGSVVNGQLGNATALITGGTADNGLWIGTGIGTVVNYGTITGGGAAGAYLQLGGTITNGATADTVATIAGAHEGVVFGAGGTLTNYGTVLANGSNASQQVIGAFLGTGGAVANLGSAADIAGIDGGVVIEGAAGTLTNQGTISASGPNGVGGELTAGGSIVNTASGVLSGGFDGVLAVGGTSDIVVNSGTISGGAGVDFKNSVTTGAGTVINSGVIRSTGGANGYAVIFGAGTERLVMQQGGTLVGKVLGNNTSGNSTVLELGTGTSGTLTALGSDNGTVFASTGTFGFSAVGTIAIDSGASWSAASPESFDTLSNAGALGVTGGLVTFTGSLANSGSLSVTAGTLSASIGSVLDSGVIAIGTGGTFRAAGGGISAAGVSALLVGGGAASALNVIGGVADSNGHRIDIGSTGQGAALIEQGGTLLAGTSFSGDAAIVIGTGATATGAVTVSDSGSRLTAAGQIDVGAAGVGSLLIENQATVQSGQDAADTSQGIDIGQLSGASGGVTVTGTKSLLSNTGRFVVGDAGVGSLSIESGGSIVTGPGGGAGLAGAVVAATASAGGSSVNVVGAGSNWQVGGSLVVGAAGSGSVSLAQGATVTAGALDLGSGAAGSANVSVVGVGSGVTVTGALTVGDQGIGELSILSGATLSAGDGNVGVGAASSGNVDIEGAGSRLNLSGSLTIGVLGSASFTLGQGTTLMVAGNLLTGAGGTFNQSGLVDPTNIINDGITNLKTGAVDLADVSVQNSGQYTISNGAATIYTPLITFDADPNTDAGSTNGVWTIKSSGTLILNSATVDNSQVFQFSTTNGVLVIGQQPSVDVNNHVTGTLAQNAANVLPDFSAPIQNYKSGDQIQLPGLTYQSATASGNVVTVWSGTNGTGTALGTLSFLTLAGSNDSTGAGLAATQLTTATLCFLPGTLIAVPDGEAQVQSLKVGDLVRTARGGVRPVTWIGTGKVLATRGWRTAATPVIVKRSAFGPGVPHQDLRVTKGHAFMFDGALIPVEFLVNHRSILWDDRAQEVTLYHVELDAHDVLIANGAPAESYRDDGNRWLFHNANSGWSQPPKKPCAPILTGGPVVDAVWRQLLDMTGARPGLPLTADPDLHLVVNGRRIDGRRFDEAYVFVLPGNRSSVQVYSRSGVPAEFGLSRDPRELGVAIRQIVVRHGNHFRLVSSDDAALSDGFHDHEPSLGLRWTNGAGVLPASLFAGFPGCVELVIHLGGTTSYVYRDVSRVA